MNVDSLVIRFFIFLLSPQKSEIIPALESKIVRPFFFVCVCAAAVVMFCFVLFLASKMFHTLYEFS